MVFHFVLVFVILKRALEFSITRSSYEQIESFISSDIHGDTTALGGSDLDARTLGTTEYWL